MNLRSYIKTLDKPTFEYFAGACETTVGQLRQVAYDNRRASAKLAINIERETCGAVTCEELRNDIDWAFLRKSSLA
ncbi:MULTISPECIES: YdaS family helix-turn-helix protein [Pseudomonas]|uniref:YdaS family helix-turn-helix protein n=1 Tax=Pseudomonas TaxID=286 RepID=UPI002B1E6A80|nr:YdaS family helix-turn-helix protein [Pseudomonas bubulae]